MIVDTKTFVFRYQTPDGRRPSVCLGRFPLVSLAEARNQAKVLAATVSKGKDPADKRRKRLSSPTFAEVAEELLNSPQLAQRKESTRREYRRILERDLLPVLGHFRASEIGKRHIIKALDKVSLRGSELMACRMRDIAGITLSFAVEREIIAVNPVSGVRKPAPERTRDRYLNKSEIKTLWAEH